MEDLNYSGSVRFYEQISGLRINRCVQFYLRSWFSRVCVDNTVCVSTCVNARRPASKYCPSCLSVFRACHAQYFDDCFCRVSCVCPVSCNFYIPKLISITSIFVLDSY